MTMRLPARGADLLRVAAVAIPWLAAAQAALSG
jgi:hypothetical protein